MKYTRGKVKKTEEAGRMKTKSLIYGIEDREKQLNKCCIYV